MSAIVLSLTLPAHAEILAQLHARCFDEPWDARAMYDLLISQGAFGLIGATDTGSAPAAFALARRALDEAEVLTLGVVPEARGRRLGLAILTGLLSQAARDGVRSMFLEVAADNAPAKVIYAAAGFQPAGLRKGYYGRKGAESVDALVLRRDLEAGP